MDPGNMCIKTVEMHTAGEPVRIITSGFPPTVPGKTLLQKIKYIRENLDHVRKLVIFEPRGHFDMYGVIFVEPDVQDATVGCVFIHNEGYATMCGHAVISLGRYVIDHGVITNPTSPETRLVMQCPCGPVEVFVEYKDGKTGNVRFNSVPSYLYKKDVEVEMPGHGRVVVDICYGGAFYAVLPSSRLGLPIDTPSQKFREVAKVLKGIIMSTVKITHPDGDTMAFLYGVIFTDDEEGQDTTSNICVFADQEVDRSPCGSGTTSRVAQMYARGLLKLNQQRSFKSPTGSIFKARPVRTVTCGDHEAVVVEVSGRGYYTGSSTFTLEADDEVGRGFLLK